MKFLFLAALGAAGCVGAVGTTDETPAAQPPPGQMGPPTRPGAPVGMSPPIGTTSTPGQTPATTPPPAAAPKTGFSCNPKLAASAPARLWRLTDRQYARTVAALLGGRSKDANRDLTPPTGIAFPFGFVNENDRFSTSAVSYKVDELSFRSALAAADKVSEKLAAGLSGSCLGQTGAFGPCLESLIADKGAILFRRPLAREEITKYVGLATKFEPTIGRPAAAEHAFQAMLMAPQFLFRAELGEQQNGKLVLSPYEIAAALSYALTDGPPDEALWADAGNGALSDKTNIEKHVVRLLGSSGHTDAMGRFFREYFRYGATRDVAKTDKTHDAEGLVRDTDAFVKAMLADGKREFLKTLLTSPVAFVSKTTGSSYGRTSVAVAPERLSLDGQRFGILTQPAWLTAFSQPEMNDPIRRGRFVQESLLCGHIPEVNIDDIPMIPADPTRTLRAKLSIHTENPTCKACHNMMDPIGLGFEGFDHYGRVRTLEAGKPVDPSGSLVGSGDRDGAFKDARELVEKLASSRTVTECFVSHAFQYWMGRVAEQADGCTLTGAVGAYDAAGGDLTALMKSFFTSDSFLVRKL